MVTSCFLLSGLCRTWCISLGAEARRTKFALFSFSRITTYVKMEGENARDATHRRWCLLCAESQRLHPIHSPFTEGPIACSRLGFRCRVRLWVGVAMTQVLIHHRDFDAPKGTSGCYDGERRMEQR